MAEGQHGGYRRPSKPAPTSPPGALSRRTDGGPTQAPMVASGGPYGSRAEMEAIQSGAPLRGGGAGPATAGPTPVPLDAPTANPNEPVTAGADRGPGIGAAAAGIRSDEEVSNEQLRPLLRSLELVANLPGSNAETRSLVRNLKARLSRG